MANPDKFLVHQFHAPQTRRLQKLNLRLHKQLKCDFGNEQARPRTRRVPNRSPDVLCLQIRSRVDRVECVSEYIIEDVVNPRAAAEFLGGYIERCPLDGRNEVSRELSHETKNECALGVCVTEYGGVAEGVEFLLSLAHERVESCFHIWEFVSNVVHQYLC